MSTTSAPLDLHTRIHRLEAIEEIKQLQSTYSRTCDLGADPDVLMSLFVTEDADGVAWRSNLFGEHHGLAAIRAHFSTVATTMPWAAHFMVNPIIEVQEGGESATGRWDLLEFATMARTDGDEGLEAVFMTGWYTNEFRLVDGRWRFHSIDIRMQHLSGWREGWVLQPNRAGAAEDVAAGRALG